MLSREDSRRLAQMERQLWRDDPDFCSRMAAGQADPVRRRRRAPIVTIFTAALLWMAAVILGVVGWWIPAAVAAVCATALAVTVAHRLHRPPPAATAP